MSGATTSPRLHSPPPPIEDQLGPPSPSHGASTETQQEAPIDQETLDRDAARRVRPGTKAADFQCGPPVVPLSEMNSAFDLKEHAKALYNEHTQNRRVALTRETAAVIAMTPSDVPRNAWLYELCVLLTDKCNALIVGLYDGTCTAQTCPSMRASEWQFLCAAHQEPKDCAAIDYSTHTLNWAAHTLTRRNFAESLRTCDEVVTEEQMTNLKQITSIFRRIHRIFAHAWFQHSDVFWDVENRNGLYIFFKIVCDTYELLPQEAHQLPPQAEGLESTAEQSGTHTAVSKSSTSGMLNVSSNATPGPSDDSATVNLARTNTRRHIRSARSTGFVSTVPAVEEDESEEHDSGTQSGEDAANLALPDDAINNVDRAESDDSEVGRIKNDDDEEENSDAEVEHVKDVSTDGDSSVAPDAVKNLEHDISNLLANSPAKVKKIIPAKGE